MLQNLQSACVDYLPGNEDFEKQDNMLLNGLKKFSPTNEVYCTKCDTNVRVTKNGKVKDTYQFQCVNGDNKHYLSATQIIESIPDEWITELLEPCKDAYRIQLLNWIGKEYLHTELWEIKGLKNATKRFSSELSPIKGSVRVRPANARELQRRISFCSRRKAVFSTKSIQGHVNKCRNFGNQQPNPRYISPECM